MQRPALMFKVRARGICTLTAAFYSPAWSLWEGIILFPSIKDAVKSKPRFLSSRQAKVILFLRCPQHPHMARQQLPKGCDVALKMQALLTETIFQEIIRDHS